MTGDPLGRGRHSQRTSAVQNHVCPEKRTTGALYTAAPSLDDVKRGSFLYIRFDGRRRTRFYLLSASGD